MSCCRNCNNEHYYLKEEVDEPLKNYVFYNEQYYIIIHKSKDKITKIIKVYKKDEQYGIFVFANPEYEDYNEAITFSFRNIEDGYNGLYNIFLDFYSKNSGEIAFDNCQIKMRQEGQVLWIDFTSLTKSNNPYINIVSNNLESYNVIEQLYTNLSKTKPKKFNMKQLTKISQLK